MPELIFGHLLTFRPSLLKRTARRTLKMNTASLATILGLHIIYGYVCIRHPFVLMLSHNHI